MLAKLGNEKARSMFHRFVCVVLTVCATTASGLMPVHASNWSTPWTELHASRVRLIAGPAGTGQGQYLAGLEMVLADGWKTYWRMPGDSGVPPSFDWSGSVNLAKATALFPAPMRMPEGGGMAIGYKGAVLLPIRIVPQDSARPVNLKLALEFGVCREICIPATAHFELSIPPVGSGAPPPEIASALDRVPRPQDSRRAGDPKLEKASIDRSGPVPRLLIEVSFPNGANNADVFVEAPEGLYVPIPKLEMSAGKNRLRFESTLGPDLVQDIKGKILTFTMVSDAGATEATWLVP